MDGGMITGSRGAVTGSLMSFKLLLLFCIKLLTEILGHIIMRLQLALLRHMPDQCLQLVRS
jgi:hypothetical protein